jgi:transcriptional regulator with XRE-family HTH domain
MPSFQISITPSRRAAARFISGVRRKILTALEEESKKRGLKQTDLARAIGVHRSVINRELNGKKDMTLGRVAELGWALGRVPAFDLPERTINDGSNLLAPEIVIGPSVGDSRGNPVAQQEQASATTEPLKNLTVRVYSKDATV